MSIMSSNEMRFQVPPKTSRLSMQTPYLNPMKS